MVELAPLAAPTTVTAPESQSVLTGTLATFTANATGNPVPAVQWQLLPVGTGRWLSVLGATGASYSVTCDLAMSGYRVRALFTNEIGRTATAAATLTVSEAPIITQQPISQTATSGALAVFASGAEGAPAPTVQWQVSSDGGATWVAIAGATSQSCDVVADANSGNEYRALYVNAAGTSATNAAVLTVVPWSTANWSGFVAVGETFSSVTGSWTVPQANCAATPDSCSYQWVGIDGYGGQSVEQDGTGTDCWNGQPTYYAWYEMFGDPATNDGLPVNIDEPLAAGDAVTATTSITNATSTFSIADTTAGWTFSTQSATPASAPAQSSAEWIVERPGDPLLDPPPLTDFGTAGFTNATAVGNGIAGPISSFDHTQLETVDATGTPMAVPSALDPLGASFTDVWRAAS